MSKWRTALVILVFSSAVASLVSCSSGDRNWPTSPPDPTERFVGVQLTREGSNASYPVDGMTVLVRRAGTSEALGVTDTNGMAWVAVTVPGEYQVLKVSGRDVSGSQEGIQGREYFFSIPRTTTAVSAEYMPVTPPSVTVTSSGRDFLIQVPVPSIRRVTVIRKGSVYVGSNTGSHISGGQPAPFAGRIIVSDLAFTLPDLPNPAISDRLFFWGANLARFRLYVSVISEDMSPASWSGRVDLFNPQEHYLGFYGATAPIVLEVPSSSDWVLSDARSTFSRSNTGLSFELLRGDGSCIESDNGGIRRDPEEVHSYSYEIHRFDPF